jgi:hypothetical protein
MREDTIIWENTAPIEEACQRLFGSLCERQCVVPLAYLLHSWPIAVPSDRSVRRLLDTLAHLVVLHSNLLSSTETDLIEHLLADTDVMLAEEAVRKGVALPGALAASASPVIF